jgi:hypothetical protein
MQSSRPAGESSSTQPRKQDSGTLEDAEAAQPEDAEFGETWRSIAGGAGGEGSGKPGYLPLAKPEDKRHRGNPELSRRERRKVREPENRGNLEARRIGRRCSGRSRDWDFGAAWKREDSKT